MPHEVLKIGDRVMALPVVHGSGDFAVEVRRMMLRHKFDCLAVPLPPSFQRDVETAIDLLPTPTLVCQHETARFGAAWSPDQEMEEVKGLDQVLSGEGVLPGFEFELGVFREE